VSVATPAPAEVAALAAADPTLRRIPVKRELYADRFTTVEALRALRAASNHCFLLESAEADQRWGRYSFLGCNPSVEVTCANGTVRVRRGVDGPNARPEVEEFQVDHPGAVLRDLIAQHKSPQLPDFPPFTGGLVGYFAYDYIKYAEPILRTPTTVDPAGGRDFLDMDLMLFDQLVVFDAYRQKVVLIAGVQVGPGAAPLPDAYAAAVARLDYLEQVLTAGPRMQFEPLKLERDLQPRFSTEEYAGMVRAAQHYIHEGDIFQVVLSNPQTAPATGSLFDAYRVLRTRNPSPYMFYFTSDDVEIAGASPETLVKLDAGRLYTYPLAGTRPRGATPDEDAELERGLLADEKELAEHNMLVDLGRNDLGRISELGSVRVEEYLNVLKFSRVMHIGSTVTGRIDPAKDAVDAVDAILPAGTLSGAPKLRACQIIDELEGTQRGIYGGAIGYLDLSGNLDTCIAIRLSYKKNGTVVVQSGAGIVADSVPASEAQECVNKARAVVEALHEAEGGLA
jgi:anthranilate synthase component 1